MPASAMPSIVSGPRSTVLVEGRPCTPATAGVAVAAAAGVGVAVASATDDGDAVALAGVAVAATVAPGVAVGVGNGVAMQPMKGPGPGGHVETTIGGATLHVDVMILLVSRVTAALRANARPSTIAPVVTAIIVKARMVPRNVEFVPRLAELPTCQKTLQGLAPLMRFTELVDPVMSVDGDWKIQTEFGSPAPSSVTVPVRSAARLCNL